MAFIVFEGAEVFLFPLKFFKLRDNFFLENSFYFSQLIVLFLNELQSLLFLCLIKTYASSLLNKS